NARPRVGVAGAAIDLADEVEHGAVLGRGSRGDGRGRQQLRWDGGRGDRARSDRERRAPDRCRMIGQGNLFGDPGVVPRDGPRIGSANRRWGSRSWGWGSHPTGNTESNGPWPGTSG